MNINLLMLFSYFGIIFGILGFLYGKIRRIEKFLFGESDNK